MWKKLEKSSHSLNGKCTSVIFPGHPFFPLIKTKLGYHLYTVSAEFNLLWQMHACTYITHTSIESDMFTAPEVPSYHRRWSFSYSVTEFPSDNSYPECTLVSGLLSLSVFLRFIHTPLYGYHYNLFIHSVEPFTSFSCYACPCASLWEHMSHFSWMNTKKWNVWVLWLTLDI